MARREKIMKPGFAFGFFAALFVGLAVAAAGSSPLRSSHNPIVDENKKAQESKIAERIRKMKEDPESLFFAKSGLSPAEQERIAAKLLEDIRRATNVGGMDSPDSAKILDLARQILLSAPDTGTAQMAHWNIHVIFLTLEDEDSAGNALESYLAKYPDDAGRTLEAWDKLSVFAVRREDWGAALYYADKILEKNPDRHPLLLTKARALVKLGAAREGEMILKKIIRDAPDSVQANLADDELKALEMSSQPLELVEKYRETLNILRQFATAIATYQIGKNTLPESLASLVPDYLPRLQDADAWGNRIIYKVDAHSQKYWLASAGSDGRFDGFDQEGEYAELAGKDIIFVDSMPLFVPRILR